MNIKAYITHKLSEDYSSCQDYFSINGENKAICLSDGMSQSIFPDYWAKIVSQHVASTFEFSENSRINKLCPLWNTKVQEYIDKEKAEGRNPWRLESNLEEGISAGCTICAVKFLSPSEWKGMVLGDSCIIAVHWDSDSIEIISSEDKEFDSYPDYVDSNPANKGKGKIRKVKGAIDKNTTLLLVSDPFSEYLSKQPDVSILLAKELVNVQTHDEFVALVARWRENGMHNDDSTLVVINHDEQEEFNVDVADNLETLIKEESEPNKSGEGKGQENLPTIATEDSASEQASLEENEGKSEKPTEPSLTVDSETKEIKVASEATGIETSNSELPVCGNVIDIQFLKDNSEDVVERFLESQRTRSFKELFDWMTHWRQQVKATLMKYNEFILSIESTEDYDTDTSS